MKYEAVIGLEVHLQLAIKTKAFSGANAAFGLEANSAVDCYTLALPGTLPRVNKEMITSAITLGLATNSKIRRKNSFARKHYFYPDLPKGYQITQFDEPICENGYIEIKTVSGYKKIRIKRIHMEEDAGKNIHSDTGALIDLNRAGVPLLEVVSEPDLRTPEEAVLFLKELRQIVRYLDIGDCNMEEGSMRCDANISLRLQGDENLGVKTELKNINSFKFIEKGLSYEIARQTEVLEKKEKIIAETRLFDSASGITRVMRTKEGLADYRYMPEPDLPMIIIREEEIEKVKSRMNNLPKYYEKLLVTDYGLNLYEADVLISEKENVVYFLNVIACLKNKSKENAKLVCKWIIGDFFSALKKTDLSINKSLFTASYLAELIEALEEKKITGKMAKDIFEESFQKGLSPKKIILERGLKQLTDSEELLNVVLEVIAENQRQVTEYLNGKTNLLQFFIGQVMKKTGGLANPENVKKLLLKNLNNV